MKLIWLIIIAFALVGITNLKCKSQNKDHGLMDIKIRFLYSDTSDTVYSIGRNQPMVSKYEHNGSKPFLVVSYAVSYSKDSADSLLIQTIDSFLCGFLKDSINVHSYKCIVINFYKETESIKQLFKNVPRVLDESKLFSSDPFRFVEYDFFDNELQNQRYINQNYTHSVPLKCKSK